MNAVLTTWMVVIIPGEVAELDAALDEDELVLVAI